MRVRLATGTPVIDGIGWIGCVVANVGRTILAVELGADDVLDVTAWREFPRSCVWLSRGVGYVARSKGDIDAVIASWHRKCGSLTECACERAASVPRGPTPRRIHSAVPRRPVAGAVARHADAA
jgi:hypothetical protein